MGRSILVGIFLLGLFAAMAGRLPSRGTSLPPTVVVMNVAGAEGQRSSEAAQSSSDGAVELQRNDDGHFYADVQINGANVHALVDTGASGIALSRDDARAAGIATSIGMNDVIGRGADGDVRGEAVTIDKISLGPASAEHMDAIVLNSGEQSLLGQEFLAKFNSVEIHGDTMVLR